MSSTRAAVLLAVTLTLASFIFGAHAQIYPTRLFLTCSDCSQVSTQVGFVFLAPLNTSVTVGDVISAQIAGLCPNPISNEYGLASFEGALLTYSDPSTVLRQNDVICAVLGGDNTQPSTVHHKKATTHHQHHAAKTLSVHKKKSVHPVIAKKSSGTKGNPIGWPYRLAVMCSKQENSRVLPVFIGDDDSILVEDVLTAVNERCNMQGTGLYLTGAGSIDGGELLVPQQVLLPLNQPAYLFIQDGDALFLVQ